MVSLGRFWVVSRVGSSWDKQLREVLSEAIGQIARFPATSKFVLYTQTANSLATFHILRTSPVKLRLIALWICLPRLWKLGVRQAAQGLLGNDGSPCGLVSQLRFTVSHI